MDEYKFKAKCISNGAWVYGDLISYKSGERAILAYPFSTYGYEATEIYNRIKVDPDTVSSFTGLLDKNGKEIYKHDIVRATNWNPSIGEVRFIEGGFCVFFEEVENYPTDINMFYDSTGCDIEVIGNVFDNPELLNRKERI